MDIRKLSILFCFSWIILINVSATSKSKGLFATIKKYAEDNKISKSNLNTNTSAKDLANTTRTTFKRKRTDFVIPEDYNKLEVPILSTREFFEMYGLPWDENLTDVTPPLEIYVGILIRNIRDIDEVEGQITVVVDFITKWHDPMIFLANTPHTSPEDLLNQTALAHKKRKILDPEFINQLWKPDLFVENVASITRTDLFLQPIKFVLSGDGLIILSARINIKIDCDMEFRYYPADIQHCVFKIRSYSHTTEEIDLKWKSAAGAFLLDRKESNFDVKITSLRKYVVNEPFTVLTSKESEIYAVLEFTLSTRRRLSFHLMQTYIPSIFFIIISWLCCLMTSKWVEVKIAACMTTLLTMTSLFSSVREHSPSVSYIKSLDIWMVGSIFFVFLNLFLFIVVLWLRSIAKSDDSSKVEKRSVIKSLINNLTKKNDAVGYMSGQEIHGSYFQPHSRTTTVEISNDEKEMTDELKNMKIKLADLIDTYSFFASFSLFLLFNAVYWYFLFINSKYFDWEVDYTNNARV